MQRSAVPEIHTSGNDTGRVMVYQVRKAIGTAWRRNAEVAAHAFPRARALCMETEPLKSAVIRRLPAH
jgi:hypothetical protein